MASWRKLLRPGPVDLGTSHLDEITTPGEYIQPFSGRATVASGYPFEGAAGHLRVLPWNPGTGSVIAVLTVWDRGIVKRTFHNGVWQAWLDASGKAVG